ncbi:hypothetical protein I7I48_11533 [Histoplasma ohiense]|nr:hypothetical protein I7I48_11533 [Histoplasma ohiense (nom. inval.)]
MTAWVLGVEDPSFIQDSKFGRPLGALPSQSALWGQKISLHQHFSNNFPPKSNFKIQQNLQ